MTFFKNKSLTLPPKVSYMYNSNIKDNEQINKRIYREHDKDRARTILQADRARSE